MKVIYNYYDGTTYLLFNDDEEWPEGDWTEVAPPPGIYEPYYLMGKSGLEHQKKNTKRIIHPIHINRVILKWMLLIL